MIVVVSVFLKKFGKRKINNTFGLYVIVIFCSILGICYGAFYLQKIHAKEGLNYQKGVVEKYLEKKCFID